MDGPRVFVTRRIAAQALKQLEGRVQLEVWEGSGPPPRAELEARMPHLDGLLSLLTDPLDAKMITLAGPNFCVLSQMAVGTDNIDLAAASARRIPVGHTPGVLTEACADFAMALLLAAARRVVEGDREVRAGIWRPWGPDILVGKDLYGGTLGIVGFGRIGQAVARRAQGFGMRLLVHDLNPDTHLEKSFGIQFVTLPELLRQSDFVSIHVYLSAQTRGMFNAETLGQMKPGAVLVNTARGPIVEPQALQAALESGRLSAAALDVFDPEPIPPDSPLLAMPNVIITPHIASAAGQVRLNMAQIAVENLLLGLAGQPLRFCANAAALGPA